MLGNAYTNQIDLIIPQYIDTYFKANVLYMKIYKMFETLY